MLHYHSTESIMLDLKLQKIIRGWEDGLCRFNILYLSLESITVSVVCVAVPFFLTLRLSPLSSEDVIPKSQNKLTKLNMVCDFAVYSENALLNIYLTCNRKDYFALPSRGRRGWSALAQSDCVWLKRNLHGGSESGSAVQVCVQCTSGVPCDCTVL